MPDPIEKPAEAPTTGLVADLAALSKKHEGATSILKTIFAVISGAVSGAAVVYGLLNTIIEKKIETQLVPYGDIVAGNSLNQSESNDEAANVFRHARELKTIGALPKDTQNVIYDGLLHAIANTTKPTLFAPDFKAIKDRYDAGLGRDGWHCQEIGWYLMRTRQKVDAKTFFENSRGFYDSEHDSKSGADAVRGLLLLALLEKNRAEEQRQAKDLAKRNPGEFSEEGLPQKLRTWKQEPWFEPLGLLYDVDLKKELDAFTEELEAVRIANKV